MSFKLSSSICLYIRQILGQSWIYSKVDSSDKAQILSLRASAIAIAWQSINTMGKSRFWEKQEMQKAQILKKLAM